MKRRKFLTLVAGSSGIAGAGMTAEATIFDQDNEENLNVEFNMVDPEVDVTEPPKVTVGENIVQIKGTVKYGSSSCGSIELADIEYDPEDQHLHVLVSDADYSTRQDCTEDAPISGYEAEIVVKNELSKITVKEHHLSGGPYTTILYESDW